MERKSDTENFNPFPMTPNNNSNKIPFSENVKLNKLFWNNNNSSKIIASKNLSQIKNSYCSNPNKNKIIFPNKINELGDLNLNDSLSEVKQNNNFDPKKSKSNTNNYANNVEIKSYNFKEKENALNKNKYCFNRTAEKELYNQSQIRNNKLNNLTDESLINLNNESSIKNYLNPNVNFHFSSNSKDKNPKYSNSNTLQNVSSTKIKSNEFSKNNVIEKDNKQLIDLNKFKESHNKKIDSYILKNYISKNYNNIKSNNNSFLIKNEYSNIKDKIKNKITNHHDINNNMNIIENMNRSLGKLTIYL